MHYSDIFNQMPVLASEDNQLFSITGNPSIRINRRNNNHTNVFPKGCMGDGRTSGQQVDDHHQHVMKQTELPHQVGSQEEIGGHETEREYNESGEMPHEDGAYDASGMHEYQDGGEEENSRPQDGMQQMQQMRQMVAQPAAPMYQFEGSNMSRNPLTGYGMEEEPKKQGKRVNKTKDPKWRW